MHQYSLDTGQKAAIKHIDLTVLVNNDFNVYQQYALLKKVANCILGCIAKSVVSKSLLSLASPRNVPTGVYQMCISKHANNQTEWTVMKQCLSLYNLAGPGPL